VVLGLPRGGVVVAFEIAKALDAPLDVLVVRKLGVPWQPELAMGAVASNGVEILDSPLIQSIDISPVAIAEIVAREQEEVAKREELFRSGRNAQNFVGQTVILADDGIATGSTMLAASEAVRMRGGRETVIAVPVASRQAKAALEARGNKFVCLAAPRHFQAVGEWYESFTQVTDEEVKELLAARSGAQTGNH
jgi:putative phosphoribosyl transferase